MSPRPPAPNKPLLKSAEKIKQLEAEIEAWKDLVRFVAARVYAPPALRHEDDQHRRNLQIDICIALASFLRDDEASFDPTLIKNWLEDELPDLDYELLP